MKTKSVLLLACMAISQNCKSQKLFDLLLSTKDAQTLIDNATNHRIFFQFYHKKTDSLTLYAWPDNTGENNDTESKILKPIKKGGTIPSLDGKDALLATLHLDAARIQLLQDAINDTTHPIQTIIFSPAIVKIAQSGIYHVHYEIGGTNEPSFEIQKEGFTSALISITNTKNPSPPRAAN